MYKILYIYVWKRFFDIVTFKKKLIGVTVLRPTQVSEYKGTKVYEGIIFKELGKLTL